MTQVQEDISADAFYQEHEKVFKRQGLSCPFSINLWRHLYQACYENKSGKTFFAVDLNGNICAVLFLVWDERFVYQLLGGYMPEFAQTQAYPALIYRGIEFAHLIGRSYDFEGSMIKQIAIAFPPIWRRPNALLPYPQGVQSRNRPQRGRGLYQAASK